MAQPRLKRQLALDANVLFDLAEGKLFAHRHEGVWLTVNTPKDLRVADEHLRAHPEWLAA